MMSTAPAKAELPRPPSHDVAGYLLLMVDGDHREAPGGLLERLQGPPGRRRPRSPCRRGARGTERWCRRRGFSPISFATWHAAATCSAKYVPRFWMWEGRADRAARGRNPYHPISRELLAIFSRATGRATVAPESGTGKAIVGPNQTGLGCARGAGGLPRTSASGVERLGTLVGDSTCPPVRDRHRWPRRPPHTHLRRPPFRRSPTSGSRDRDQSQNVPSRKSEHAREEGSREDRRPPGAVWLGGPGPGGDESHPPRRRGA